MPELPVQCQRRPDWPIILMSSKRNLESIYRSGRVIDVMAVTVGVMFDGIGVVSGVSGV